MGNLEQTHRLRHGRQTEQSVNPLSRITTYALGRAVLGSVLTELQIDLYKQLHDCGIRVVAARKNPGVSYGGYNNLMAANRERAVLGDPAYKQLNNMDHWLAQTLASDPTDRANRPHAIYMPQGLQLQVWGNITERQAARPVVQAVIPDPDGRLTGEMRTAVTVLHGHDLSVVEQRMGAHEKRGEMIMPLLRLAAGSADNAHELVARVDTGPVEFSLGALAIFSVHSVPV